MNNYRINFFMSNLVNKTIYKKPFDDARESSGE